MSEAQWTIVPRGLLEQLARQGETLAEVLLADEVEVLMVHPAYPLRIDNGVVYVATSEAVQS